MLTERQENEAIKKSLSEAHGKNEELLDKVDVANKDIAKFQQNIRRSIA